jgi:hypothetical protein
VGKGNEGLDKAAVFFFFSSFEGEVENNLIIIKNKTIIMRIIKNLFLRSFFIIKI